MSIAKELAPLLDNAPIDDEVCAIHAVALALDGMEDRSARGRVLRWAHSRYPEDEVTFEMMLGFLDGVLSAVADHRMAKNGTATTDDEALWERVIKGSKYWPDPKVAPKVAATATKVSVSRDCREGHHRRCLTPPGCGCSCHAARKDGAS